MTKEKNMNKGKLFITLGVILITMSLLMTFYNKYEDIKAGKESKEILDVLKSESVPQDSIVKPLANDNEIREMKTISVNGEEYVGTITIPTLNIELPVMSEYSYTRLKKAPCRYYGNIYTNDLIICAHSYKTHFGELNRLKQKDLIVFTDVDGNNFIYEVLEIEVLKPTDVDKMVNTEFDLTLYTCTSDNKGRITVRCNKVNI